jgi:hypothetical protein
LGDSSVTFQLENSLSCLTNSQSSRRKRPRDPDHPLLCWTSKSCEVQLSNTNPILTALSHVAEAPSSQSPAAGTSETTPRTNLENAQLTNSSSTPNEITQNFTIFTHETQLHQNPPLAFPETVHDQLGAVGKPRLELSMSSPTYNEPGEKATWLG